MMGLEINQLLMGLHNLYDGSRNVVIMGLEWMITIHYYMSERGLAAHTSWSAAFPHSDFWCDVRGVSGVEIG